MTLQEYVATHSHYDSARKVIACASGARNMAMGDELFPVSIYFYPIPGAANFRYFESDTVEMDTKDFSKYRAKSLELVPMFNGYLRRFKRGPIEREVWGIIGYDVKQDLILSNPIRIKFATKPTQLAGDLVRIEARGATPNFVWEDGRVKENAIYFQVVSDASGNLLSGTYTEDKHFRFYDLANVVFNIHDVRPPPTLQPTTRYSFTLMGVSEDNWVNLMAVKPFNTGK
jgi:hypothetical protein